jgi:hypothetical protein
MPDLRNVESHSADIRLGLPIVLPVDGIGKEKLRFAFRRINLDRRYDCSALFDFTRIAHGAKHIDNEGRDQPFFCVPAAALALVRTSA